ncbi:hypothetical protein LTR10_017123 [Elasticomyces elasticus]|uniref:SAP domain-containing protein n=1 Tax=Exophiala sideris TaxID=1016849 RepID=A0ABR0JEQ3_9EURO|nr:hypothetical protein LTR10_017123 [Elasticomyces elasticus]KAK5032580.1 hypothetical protein LTS07_003989 [Exophiala sideris]KAK5037240.1 hypothetical protein LTR13_005046 [Exophiala sideris]KAK5062105.1 hypothetical protein LTR69_004462 [Exophiala sideris]KAK5182398.1 hypothetical protein LTR44_005410 [Eurotiomycetes sp. CCFEE 6388]
MTDWAKLKVADLKEECKARGIPLTGLKLKQQYIDKLEEHETGDTAQQTLTDTGPVHEVELKSAQANGHSEETQNETRDTNVEIVEHDDAGKETNGSGMQPEIEEPEDVGTNNRKDGPKDTKGNSSATDAAQEDESAVLRKAAEETHTTSEELRDAAEPPIQTTVASDAPLEPERANIEGKVEATRQDLAESTDQNTQAGDGGFSTSVPQDTLQSAQTGDTNTPSQVTPSDVEDQKKRRKRSATPVPTSEEVARKKARLSSAADDLKAEEIRAIDEMKAATQVAKEIRNESDEAIVEGINEQGSPITEPLVKSDDVMSRDVDHPQPEPPRRSTEAEDERDVPPAIHPATSSLYIRNFKRPLHIPSLRSHIVSLAKSPSSADNADPITVFYLDSIRTHAFLSFNSVAAASRVRTAMHDTRFPDEAMREPLFIDYIPDDKVQTWIDNETGGGFGRSGGGRRYEVIYEQGDDGVEAVFQEIDSSKPRPPIEPSRSSRMSLDAPKAASSLAPGIHPDRAELIPRGPRRDEHQQDRGRAPPTGPKNPGTNNNSGRGFKALDELFKSTTTKPKLYYKPVSEADAAERLDMFRNLRPGYAEMGRSGDQGMKRYSFERYKDRQEWVDNGPEFGHGKLGQDRFAGVRGRGGYRGRGGDSWRGGSGR